MRLQGNKLLVIVGNNKWMSKDLMHTNRIKYTERNNFVKTIEFFVFGETFNLSQLENLAM